MLIVPEQKQSARHLNEAILLLVLGSLPLFTVLDMPHVHSKYSRVNPLQEAVEA